LWIWVNQIENHLNHGNYGNHVKYVIIMTKKIVKIQRSSNKDNTMVTIPSDIMQMIDKNTDHMHVEYEQGRIIFTPVKEV